VEAAAQLFGERGFAATTVSDICERADVARQTFFNHFGSKDELTQALARRGHEFLVEALETALREETDTTARLRHFFGTAPAAAAQVGSMHQDLVAEVTRAAYEAPDSARIVTLQRAVEKLLRAGRAQGDISRRHPIEDQAALVMGALQYLYFAWTRRADFPMAERSARMARLLADVLAP
jgi:AcrR family transcriptional regulator